ncbi:MAG TPA: type III secretion system cytoplasmic ring protein SctQ [Chlamydiales bacterium]|nr:type III secretion system cytoplasmic ring protein SctQ [Chlamydiales bacterium]
MTLLSRWIKKHPHFLAEMSEVPLFGNAPSFDWEELTSLLAKRLELAHLQVEPIAQSWKGKEDLIQGLGLDPWAATLHFAPLDERAFLLFSRSDQQRFLSWISVESKGFSTEILKEGLTSFLLLEAIDAASSFPPLDTVAITWEEGFTLPDSHFFCIDIQLEYEGSHILVRLILPTAFREKWKHHFSHFPPNLMTPLAKSVELMAGIKIGHVALSSQEWDQVQVSDLLLLDSGTYNPDIEEGVGLLEVEGFPLFQVQILQNRLILNINQEETMDDELNLPEKEETLPLEAKEESLEEKPQSLGTVPLTLTVELARLKISLERLLQLQPGNTLEFPLDPSQPVSLTLRGKVIAKGELVQLGEKLGIQISSLK